jgi:hypothetical protein
VLSGVGGRMGYEVADLAFRAMKFTTYR